jgi:hypothetical protein
MSVLVYWVYRGILYRRHMARDMHLSHCVDSDGRCNSTPQPNPLTESPKWGKTYPQLAGYTGCRWGGSDTASVTIYARNPAYRRFVKNARKEGVTPENLEEYFGYRWYADRKKRSERGECYVSEARPFRIVVVGSMLRRLGGLLCA